MYERKLFSLGIDFHLIVLIFLRKCYPNQASSTFLSDRSFSLYEIIRVIGISHNWLNALLAG